MLGKDLSEAMGGIGDEKITAAMKVYGNKQRRRSVIYRAAALAATLAILLTAALWPRETEDGIVTAPGVMKVYAYDLEETGKIEDVDELEQYELTSFTDYYRIIYIPYVSAQIRTPFTFQIPDDYFGDAELSFDISSDYETFCDSITVENGKGIVLDSWALTKPLAEIQNEVGKDGKFYLDVVIRADGNVVGYGTITFGFDEGTCMAYRFETACYPLVDGEYQDVSEEYVRTQIAEYKQTHKDDVTPDYWSKKDNEEK